MKCLPIKTILFVKALIILLYLNSTKLYGQNIQHIQQLLQQINNIPQDTLKADLWVKISIEYQDNDEAKAKDYLAKAKEIFKKYPTHIGLGEVYYNLGYVYENFNKKDSSILCFNQAIQHAQKSKHEEYLARFYVGKGWYYMRQKDYPNAIIEYKNSRNTPKKYF